jgi:hypothetical protein
LSFSLFSFANYLTVVLSCYSLFAFYSGYFFGGKSWQRNHGFHFLFWEKEKWVMGGRMDGGEKEWRPG